MERSTIYAKCPGCGANTLVQELRGTYVCAACGFDYVARFANDAPALEAWAVETMRGGPAGQLAVLYLHPRITKSSAPASVEWVKAVAARNNVALPTGAPLHPAKLAAGVLGAVVVVVVGAALYFATR